MKKIVGILLSICLSFGVFSTLAGCKKKETGDVVIAILRGSADLTDTALVEARVSELTKAKYGFGVKFKTLSIFNALPYTNWLAANEEIDILAIAFQSPDPYIKNKTAREMDSLLTSKNAPYLVDTLPAVKSDMIKGKGPDGKTYGIGVMGTTFGAGGTYIVRKDMLEAANLYGTGAGQYVDQQKIDYDDLDIIFEELKKCDNPVTSGQPVYPTGNLATNDISGYLITKDAINGSGTNESGALIGMNSTTVENYYKTEEYKKFVNKMGEWKSKGYVHPDADTTDDTQKILFESGKFVGAFFDFTTQMKVDQGVNYGTEFVQLQILDPYYILNGGAGLYYISSKSTRPASAMKFIDLMSSDADVMTTLQRGVEGIHWEWADEEALIIQPTAAKPVAKDNGYYGMPGVFGDYGKIPTWLADGDDLETAKAKKLAIKAEDDAKSEAALANSSVAVGFKYDSSSQTARINGINAIIAQYAKTLSVGKGTKGSDGTWTGPGSTYAVFIKALDDAKIDTVIADKQAQLNAWLAAKG